MQLFLFILFWVSSLEEYYENNIINLQLIIVFVLWIDSPYSSINDFLTNILFIKFDIGFIHEFTFVNTKIKYEDESNRMTDIKFYCQSTIQNYFFLLLIALLSVILWVPIVLHYKLILKCILKLEKSIERNSYIYLCILFLKKYYNFLLILK